VLSCAAFHDLAAVIRAYLSGAAAGTQPRQAALAIAGPVTSDTVPLTNLGWRFSAAALRRELGLERLIVMNDFTALAMALPVLPPSELRQVGGGLAQPGAPIALLGPGTGLGVSGLVPAGDDWIPLQGEGGHATLAAETPREFAVIEALQARYVHVSAERVLSGPGLVNLYEALCRVDGRDPASLAPADVTRLGLAGGDPACVEVLQLFCGWLGVVAGNLALTLGATGGVRIGGGIVPQLGTAFDASPFRTRFEAKGRYREFLGQIPTAVILSRLPAFAGLSRAFESPGPRLEVVA
jgi:glucokinase